MGTEWVSINNWHLRDFAFAELIVRWLFFVKVPHQGVVTSQHLRFTIFPNQKIEGNRLVNRR